MLVRHECPGKRVLKWLLFCDHYHISFPRGNFPSKSLPELLGRLVRSTARSVTHLGRGRMKYRFECARKSKWLTNREFLSRRFRVYTSCIQMSTIAQLPSSSWRWCADKKFKNSQKLRSRVQSHFPISPLKSFLLRSRAVLDGPVMGFLRMLNVFFTSSNLTRGSPWSNFSNFNGGQSRWWW